MPLPKSPGVARLFAWLPRVRNRHLLLIDSCLLLLASWLAFAIRLDTFDLGSYALAAGVYALGVPLIDLPLFLALGLYTRCWSYANADDAMWLGGAVLLAGVLEGFVFLGLLAPLGIVPGLPRSVPLINAMLSLFCVAGPRFALRTGVRRFQRWRKAGAAPVSLQRALVVGAGEAGALAAARARGQPTDGSARGRLRRRRLEQGGPAHPPLSGAGDAARYPTPGARTADRPGDHRHAQRTGPHGPRDPGDLRQGGGGRAHRAGHVRAARRPHRPAADPPGADRGPAAPRAGADRHGPGGGPAAPASGAGDGRRVAPSAPSCAARSPAASRPASSSWATARTPSSRSPTSCACKFPDAAA